MIVSHALSIGAKVGTNNLRHFDMVDGLIVENWVNEWMARLLWEVLIIFTLYLEPCSS